VGALISVVIFSSLKSLLPELLLCCSLSDIDIKLGLNCFRFVDERLYFYHQLKTSYNIKSILFVDINEEKTTSMGTSQYRFQ